MKTSDQDGRRMEDRRFSEWLGGLGDQARVAVLRRRTEIPGSGTSGDWDLAVADAGAFGSCLEAAFGVPDLKIRRQYVEQWYYPWNQVDLLPVFEWNGVVYLDPERFWAGVHVGDDGVPRPRPAHDAFIAWMTGVLWGGTFNSRYCGLLAEAWKSDRGEFRQCLEDAFGGGWAAELGSWLDAGVFEQAASNAKGLRRALVWRRLRHQPGECVAGQLRHWWVEWLHHLHPPYPWVAFLGPDGSGKSSVIDGVMAALGERRIGTHMIHWSPRLWRKSSNASQPVTVTDPHSKKPRGVIISAAKIAMLGAEWMRGWIWHLRHPRAKSKLLLSDRYYHDLLVDPRRYRFGAPLALARACFRWMPKPDKVIILVGDSRTIHARKKEVTLEELERQLRAYRDLAVMLGERATVIDCARPLDEVVAIAYETVIACCRIRRDLSPALSRGNPHRAAEPAVFPGAKAMMETPSAGQPRRLKVLISAYACSPSRGAEANVAWNLIREMSARHDFVVMTRSIQRAAIEASTEPWVGRVTWVYIDPPRWLTFWRQGKRGLAPFYLLWHLLAKRVAAGLIRSHGIDLCHHLTIGTYLLPSPLADLTPPLIYGPVGGGERTPAGLREDFSWRGRIEEWIRDAVRTSLDHFEYFHAQYRSTAWAFAATPVTESALRRLGLDRVSMLTQSATGGDTVDRYVKERPPGNRRYDGSLKLVSASRLIHWKALDLAIEALAKAVKNGLKVELTILDEGPERPALERLAATLEVGDRVRFIGRLPNLYDVYDTMRGADGLIHPAVHEAFGQACLEALALGIPVISLNWGGPGLIVDDTCGFRIDPGTREETTTRLAEAMAALAAKLSSGADLRDACVKRSRAFQWSEKASKIEEIYWKFAR